MIDEIEGRLWTAHGASFSRWVGELIDDMAIAFERLNARTWQAPWR